jgi:hypothetical protein
MAARDDDAETASETATPATVSRLRIASGSVRISPKRHTCGADAICCPTTSTETTGYGTLTGPV